MARQGLQIVSQNERRFRTEVTFRQAMQASKPAMAPLHRRHHGLVLCVVTGLVIATTQLPLSEDPLIEVRADAKTASAALQAGDLPALDAQLAANRGQTDFAYFFTSNATPRALGDALSSVGSKSKDAPLKTGVNPHAYDVALTDLAGTLALATFGTGDRALPAKWTNNFIAATTSPTELYGDESSRSDDSGQVRAHQDLANKQNLLLLLSRGYWSTRFLQAVTDSYWKYDHDEGDEAWPSPQLEDAKYAPAPTGQYLTDGILALTAALTANSEASAWAFTRFQPGTKRIEGSHYAIGKFTHYLLFKHRFPQSSDGEGLGMTATLTALSSAIDGAADVGGEQPSCASAKDNDAGPARRTDDKATDKRGRRTRSY